MTSRDRSRTLAIVAITGGLLMAGGAMARQSVSNETPAQARARAAAATLNQGVTESSTLAGQAARQASAQPLRTPAPISQNPTSVQPPAAPASTEPAQAEAANLLRGYYARADKNCNQVWPGDGELAFLSDTAFTIDFGGCEPGLIQQLSPTTWHEDQRCVTELGGDGGAYSIDYELTGPGEILRTAHLALDQSVESQSWKHCEAEDVPAEARFRS